MDMIKPSVFRRPARGRLTGMAAVPTVLSAVLLTGGTTLVVAGGQPSGPGSSALVDTPYGRVPAAEVVALSPRQTLKTVNGRLAKVDIATGQVLANVTPAAGAYREAAFSRSLASGQGTTLGGDCPTAAATNIKSFSTTWTVPSKPVNPASKKTYFVWNGLDRGVLQPVLTWGNNQAAYRISAWAYTGKYIHGPFVSVKPGQQVTGVITLLSHTATSWTYKEGFAGYPQTDLTITRSSPADGVIQCIESYAGSDTTAVPADTMVKMRNIKLTTTSGQPPVTFTWRGNSSKAPRTVVANPSSSAGEVDLYFHDIPAAPTSPAVTPTPSLSSPPTSHTFTLDGTTHLTAGDGDATLKGTLQVSTGTGGTTNANLAIEPTSIGSRILQFLPMQQAVSFIPAGTGTATVTNQRLALTAKMTLTYTSVSLFGFRIAGGPQCTTSTPVTIHATAAFNPRQRVPMSGTYDLQSLSGTCDLGTLAAYLAPSKGNTINATLAPAT